MMVVRISAISGLVKLVSRISNFYYSLLICSQDGKKVAAALERSHCAGPRSTFAKRLECVRLAGLPRRSSLAKAGAFDPRTALDSSKSGSKLHALQTLRAFLCLGANACQFQPLAAFVALLLFFELSAAAATAERTTLMVIVGAPGEAEFGSNFTHEATLWQTACAQPDCRLVTVGLDADGPTNDCERLKELLAIEPKDGPGQLWLVLIGHGTFDGKEPRFNLRGPDVSATDLAQWLQPFRRPMAVINTASSSAPFLNKLSATNRIIITATRSGHEQNYARFGQFLAEAITNPEADLDRDGQVSLLEAFLMASRQTAEFYQVEGRLATEHALLDDNGDGLGTPADWFSGLRAVKRARENAALDGLLARQFQLVPSEAERKLAPEQRARRDALERAVLLHREKKGHLDEDQYYRELEKLLLEVARFYDSNSTATAISPK